MLPHNYIMCSDSDLYGRGLQAKYIGTGSDDGYYNGAIKFADVLENEGFSSTQTYLIKCAANLFNATTYNDLNIGNIIQCLSKEQFSVYEVGMKFLRNEISLSDVLDSEVLEKDFLLSKGKFTMRYKDLVEMVEQEEDVNA